MISLVDASVEPLTSTVEALLVSLGFDIAYEMRPNGYSGYARDTVTIIIDCPDIMTGRYEATIAAALICPDYTSLVYLRVLDTPADRWAYICARPSSTSDQPGRFEFGQQCCIADKELSGEQLVAAFTPAG